MAARVIYFGCDDCYRVAVLRAAGFEVREARTLECLHIDLQRDEQVDAIVFSQDDHETFEEAASAVRQNSTSPLILFRRGQDRINEATFDKVFYSLAPPESWFAQTADLIAQSVAIREQSARLMREAKAVVNKARWQRARSRVERERSPNLPDPWLVRESDVHGHEE